METLHNYKEETADENVIAENGEEAVIGEPSPDFSGAAFDKFGQNENKRVKILGKDLIYLCFFGIIFAFLGWVAENIARGVTQGVVDSRYHILPFISPYGLVPLAYHVLLGDPDDITVFGKKIFKVKSTRSVVLSNIMCLGIICGGVFVSELIVGNLWKILFDVQLWNYSSQPFNVTQYAGLIPTVGYGGGAYLIFKFLYKPVFNLIVNKVSFRTAKIVVLTLGVLILLDTAIMTAQIIFLKEVPVYWSIKI